MQLADMTNDKRRWDDYRAFHWNVATGFVQFETGELIYTFTAPDPNDRHVYRQLNVQIVSTADRDCPHFVTPEGDRVLTTWLNRTGMQYLAVDLTTGRAVRLLSSRARSAKGLPEDRQAPFHLQGRFSAYWSGPGRDVIGGDIPYAPPMKYEGAERQHLDDLRDQCVAWCAMMGIEPSNYARKVVVNGDTLWVHTSPIRPASVVTLSFTELEYETRINLAECGYSSELKMLKAPYLKVAH